MAKAKLIFYSLLLVAIAAGFVFRGAIVDFARPVLESKLQEFEKAATDALIQGLKEQVSASPQVQLPPPLRAPVSGTPQIPQSAISELTVLGTIIWTNTERAKSGLPPLAENIQLNAVAELRLRDMFEKQYFAHVSPLGEDVQGAAKFIGYEYITLGENLALGGFENDQILVQAWMDSPGHRANILNDRYTEIGIAVRRGAFDGRIVWLAVQIFGKPLALCPQPSMVLKAQIEILQSQLEEAQEELEARKEEIENTQPKRGPEYNRKVNEYNALVAQYNEMVEQLKVMVADYNAQTTSFNECLAR